MKSVDKCDNLNCIPTPAMCVDWDGGDIEALGICNGEKLPVVIWEIVTKLEELAGEDISQFDIDELLDICNQKKPLEITLISILSLLRDNQVCIKDYIDTLNDKINELSTQGNININLKCYADLDNLGNSLSITREALDQLVINELCNHKQRLDSVEGDIINIKTEIQNLELNTTVEELSIATCLDSSPKPTSTQLIKTTKELCDLEGATGSIANIATAMSKTPSTDNSRYGLILGWDLSPANEAATIGNLLLKVANLESRLIQIETNCCALTCDDIKLGFSAVFNEDMTGIIIKFSSGAGTSIPSGFTDKGSTGTITDIDGNVETFSLVISNNLEQEVIISGLNLNKDLTINITAKLGNDTLTCDKCLNKIVKSSACGFCEITATGDDTASAVIIYTTNVNSNITNIPNVPRVSTTTTTTISE